MIFLQAQEGLELPPTIPPDEPAVPQVAHPVIQSSGDIYFAENLEYFFLPSDQLINYGYL